MPTHKIGVLTFHRCINYGSYWQARCLVEGLKARGHEVVLLDHHSAEVTRAEWRCAFQPLLPERSPRADIPSYAAKARKFFRAFDALPLSERFCLDDPHAMEPRDLVVVGSDEVWNFRHPWYANRGIFFGSGLASPRTVSYAASFGNHDADHGMNPFWAEKLRQFGAISVRDENSRRLIEEALGEEPAMVLDPCLQFPPEVTPGEAEEPYVAVYGHSFPAWFKSAIRRWAKARGLKLIGIGYRNDWTDANELDAGPHDFARLIAGASAVVTNFFHGCIFALINGKPFAVAGSPYRMNKVRDLTDQLGASDHLVDEDAPEGLYNRLLGEPLDTAIHANIAARRRRSDAYLDAILA